MSRSVINKLILYIYNPFYAYAIQKVMLIQLYDKFYLIKNKDYLKAMTYVANSDLFHNYLISLNNRITKNLIKDFGGQYYTTKLTDSNLFERSGLLTHLLLRYPGHKLGHLHYKIKCNPIFRLIKLFIKYTLSKNIKKKLIKYILKDFYVICVNYRRVRRVKKNTKETLNKYTPIFASSKFDACLSALKSAGITLDTSKSYTLQDLVNKYKIKIITPKLI